MKKTIVILTAIALATGGLTGCANMTETQRDTGSGAAIGALAGAMFWEYGADDQNQLARQLAESLGIKH